MKQNTMILSTASLLLALFALPLISPLVDAFLAILQHGNLPKSEAETFLNMDKGYPALFLNYYSGLISGREPLATFLAGTAGCFAVVGLSALYWLSQKSQRTSEDSLLGKAEIIDNPKSRRKANSTWDGSKVPEKGGLVLGFENGNYLFAPETPHCLTVGRTGSGKSRLVLLPTLHLAFEAGFNVIVLDIKSELYELTSDKASEKANTVLLDLESPMKGNRYNPLEIITEAIGSGDEGRARDYADRLAADLVPPEDKNPFFSNAARGLLCACFLAVSSADIPKKKKNMASVCAMIDEGTSGYGKDPAEPLKNFFKDLGHDHPAFSPASEFLSSGDNTAAKNVLSTVKVALRPLSSPAMRWMTAKSDSGINEMISKHTVVYLRVLGKNNPSNVVLTAFLNQWWMRARQLAEQNGGRVPHETALALDEFGNFPKIEAIPEICTLGRSYRIHFWGFVQSIGQLSAYNKPGDGGAGQEEILSNIGIKIALGLSSQADCEYFTKLVGKRTVMASGSSRQKSQGRGSFGTSASERADDLIHPWEWQGFSPDRDGAIVVKAKENGAEDRNGVFRMPLADATLTPAGRYFGLGSPDFEAGKRAAVRAALEKKERSRKQKVPTWHIDFGEEDESADESPAVEKDEFSAWDE